MIGKENDQRHADIQTDIDELGRLIPGGSDGAAGHGLLAVAYAIAGAGRMLAAAVENHTRSA